MTIDQKARERRFALLKANVDDTDAFVEDYEWTDGDGGYHTPSKKERILIADAIAGLLADDNFVRSFNAWQDEIRGIESSNATKEKP